MIVVTEVTSQVVIAAIGVMGIVNCTSVETSNAFIRHWFATVLLIARTELMKPVAVNRINKT